MERDGRHAFEAKFKYDKDEERAHADKKRADATEFGPVSLPRCC